MKIILPFLEPLGFIWLVLFATLAWSAVRRHFKPMIGPAVVWLLLSLITCTPLASALLAHLERTFPVTSVDQIAQADVILCLGGGASPSPNEPTGIHLKIAGDRISTALLLAHSGKAHTLVFGGGGYEVEGRWESEADMLQKQLTAAGFGHVEVLSLGLCADTHDEAVNFARLFQSRQWQRVLLVTSAYHLPRAVRTFAKAGVQVVPMPCNYMSAPLRGGGRKWLTPPALGGLENFNLWLHEALGSLYYRWQGWI